MDSHARQAQEGEEVKPDIEVPTRAVAPVSNLLVVQQSDVDALKKQRALLADFVKSQLVKADFRNPKDPGYGEGDFGVIPGTKKNCLFKQGAEKLQKLFQLGCRFRLVDKDIDRKQKFAIFTYRAEVFHLASGITIADCEGSANSQEVKYKERTVWRVKKVKGREVREGTKEETPIEDVLNTLMKMAQKRAMIGATIIATGASEYFTQDLLEPEEIAQKHREEADQESGGRKDPEGEDGEEPPIHCEKPMMVSRYVDRDLGHKPWYCTKCGHKEPREETP